MEFTEKQLKTLIREAFWSKKEINSVDDVTTVGDLRKLIASAQGAKKWEQTKGATSHYQPLAITNQPSAFSQSPSLNHQLSVISHQPSAISH